MLWYSLSIFGNIKSCLRARHVSTHCQADVSHGQSKGEVTHRRLWTGVTTQRRPSSRLGSELTMGLMMWPTNSGRQCPLEGVIQPGALPGEMTAHGWHSRDGGRVGTCWCRSTRRRFRPLRAACVRCRARPCAPAGPVPPALSSSSHSAAVAAYTVVSA